ncbi:MAG: extracellular solute-binding protein [Candidatus Abawacabacteria bacterium]|nr:extracellular solute-binding protein [Candidatus Abawacabacteria bacterium]
MNFSSSQIKLFAIVTGVILVFVLAFAFFLRPGVGEKSDITLTIWGVGDEQGDFQTVFQDFIIYAKQAPQYRGAAINIEYRSWRSDEYETLLLNQLAEGKGPDIFYIHNTWLPKYHNKLLPLPADQLSLDQFKEEFVPVTFDDLVYEKKVYALPHYVDTLALYYNTQHYQSGASGSSRPANTWSALKAQIAAMTSKNGNQLTRSAIGLGTMKNIKYAVDLIYLQLVQRSGKLCQEVCTAVSVSDNVPFKEAVNEYTGFSDPNSTYYTWDSNYLKGHENNNIFNDIDAFIRGRVSSVFAYASDYQQIKTLGQANNLNFAIAEVPQLDAAARDNERITFANYWSMAVSRNSGHPQLAWDFIKYFTTAPILAKFYEEHPRPVSREDMINTSTENPLRVFDRQAKYAKSVIVYDDARFTQILSDNIEDIVNKNSTLIGALQKMEAELNKVLAPYAQLPSSDL